MIDSAITNPRPMPEEIPSWGYLAYKTAEERHEIMEMDSLARQTVMERLKLQVDARRFARK